MILDYLPLNNILIDGVSIKFHEHRKIVRDKLGSNCIEDNQTIQVGNSTEDLINVRRDIYKIINNKDCFFILNFDEMELLNEIEVHHCNKIRVNNFEFSFNDELDYIVSGLSKFSYAKALGEGECFFKEIKVSIVNKRQMGGNENTLGYFYFAEDVSHLES